MFFSLLVLSSPSGTRCQFGMPNRDTYLELLCNFGFGRSVVALVLFSLILLYFVMAHKSTRPDHNIFFRFCKYCAVLWNRVYCIERTSSLCVRSLLLSFVARHMNDNCVMCNISCYNYTFREPFTVCLILVQKNIRSD